MFCTRCGVSHDDSAKFCSQCGAPIGANAYSAPAAYPKLSRPREDRKIGGVCAGFARYLGVDVTLIRLIWVVLAICSGGLGAIAYVVAWIIMPNDPLRLPHPAPLHPAGGSA
ncbi:MAG TPA: PspC domain-containing protein [Bryobacteraceae bacterium]|nr:PspC domain-containing protein [Bryobacteraceae bacterium]